MKKTRKVKAAVAGLIAVIGLVSACEKAENLTSAESDSSLLEAKEVSDEMDVMHRPGHMGKMLLPLFDECDFPGKLKEHTTITTSGDSYPKTITITHESTEGKRSAKATIVLSDHMKNAGATQTMTMQRDGKRGSSNATVTIVNLGSSATTDDARTLTGSEMAFSVEVSGEGTGGGHCKKGEDTEVTKRSFSGEVILQGGAQTAECDDDVFIINGTGTMQRGDNETFVSTIDAVTIDQACDHPVSGTIAHADPMGELTINFGSGACDSEAEVTRDGETKTVDLDEVKPRGHGPKGKRK